MINYLDTLQHYIISRKNVVQRVLGITKKNCLYTDNIQNLPAIDIVIPVIAKDVYLLPITLQHLKANCQNPISNIFIISPNDIIIKEFCVKEQLVWVDETVIQPVTKDVIYKYINNKFLVNWIYQQFLKLSIDKIIKNDYCLILDCDTILLSKQYFVSNTKMILKTSDEYHFLYKKTNKALLKNLHFHSKSFITHHQLIKISILKELKAQIEQENKQNAFLAILSKCGSNFNKFSEYELYGTYAYTHYQKELIVAYWHNKNLKAKHFKSHFTNLSKKFYTASFHSYNYDLFNN